MNETLFPYYERELTFIRQFAQDFARQYPRAAGRLLLEPTQSTDPHIERLIESFALVAGRIHRKLDDEFPELTDALLGLLYPHYLAPVPSMAIVQFELDPERGTLPDGFRIERHSKVATANLSEGPCKYRTGYPVTLWPIAVTSAELLLPPFPAGLQPPPRTPAALCLHLECQGGMSLADLSLDRLRFFLSGENHIVSRLYGLIFNHTTQVVFRKPDSPDGSPILTLPPSRCLFQVGFEPDEILLPYTPRSFPGYCLLTELFTFPSKFLFLDLGGFQQVCRAGYDKQVEVVMFLNQPVGNLAQAVDADTFRLGCTPMINLFEQTAETINVTHERYEYRIVPDVARPLSTEIYSVDAVISIDPATSKVTEYQPFYAFRHGVTERQRTFWHATRKLAAEDRDPTRKSALEEKDRGTDVFLSLVDLDFDPGHPGGDTLVVRTTCTNRNQPDQFERLGEQLPLRLEAAAPLSSIRCLRTPTRTLRPPLRRRAYWRLLSHLSLNHLSLSDPVEGLDALKEILRLYDNSDTLTDAQLASANRLLIEGIASLSSRPVGGRVGPPATGGFALGVEVTATFDEKNYVGTGVFLVASVLERFLGQYVSINSFTQLVARTMPGDRILKKWPPRVGNLALL
jgi:type VI secretion system protein ImpG